MNGPTPAEQAALDQANAMADEYLDVMVERYRTLVAEVGPELAVDVMQARLERSPWTQESLATMSTYALRRLAQR